MVPSQSEISVPGSSPYIGQKKYMLESLMLLCDIVQVTVFQQEHYLANFVQSTFDALPQSELTGKTTVLLIEYTRFVWSDAISSCHSFQGTNGEGQTV
jgi:hypothetical protein